MYALLGMYYVYAEVRARGGGNIWLNWLVRLSRESAYPSKLNSRAADVRRVLRRGLRAAAFPGLRELSGQPGQSVITKAKSKLLATNQHIDQNGREAEDHFIWIELVS